MERFTDLGAWGVLFLRQLGVAQMTEKTTYEELEQRVEELTKHALEGERAHGWLRESEQRYRRIAEVVTDYIYTVRIEEGRPVETIHGPACVTITGYTPEDFETNPYLWLQMVHEEDRRAVEEQASQILSGVRVGPLEHRIIHKDGTIRWVRHTPALNFDGSGRLSSYDGLIQDITERKEAEEALRESAARYRALFENMSNGVAIYEARNNGEDFAIVDFNKGAERIDNIKREALIGRNVLEAFPGVRDFGLFDVFQRVWSTGEPEAHPVGFYEDERMTGWRDNFVYRLPSGEIVAIYSDETERKRAEEALRKSHEELELKVKQRTHDLNERVKELNCLYGISRLVAKQGISLGEILQGAVGLIARSWQYPEIACARIIFEEQEFKTAEFRETPWKQACDIFVHYERTGVLEICYLEERPEADEGPFVKEERSLINSVAGRLGKIAELIKAEEALRESEDRLREDQKRMEILKFANDVALKLMDELRNPLVTIGGFSRRISSGDYPEVKLKEYGNIIFEQSKRLDSALNDALLHLKTTAGQT